MRRNEPARLKISSALRKVMFSFAEEPCETFVESDDAVSLLQEGFCHAAHYRIHARCRAAARENGDRFVSFGHIVSDFIAL